MADTTEIPETSFDASIQENNDDMEVVTMVDILKEEQEREADANAVLGGSDEKNCTYSKGYLKRQALYACVTCIPESKNDPTKRAGVCLACSYSCHENHELIELYTKRNFRCDCGNSKFPNVKCTLEPEKAENNEENIYDHNFSGLYCFCARPYPDPEDTVSDDMIQCIICEDWFHCRHLETEVPSLSSYSEMICKTCVSKHEFLLNYGGFSLTKPIAEEDTSISIIPNIKVEKDADSFEVASKVDNFEAASKVDSFEVATKIDTIDVAAKVTESFENPQVILTSVEAVVTSAEATVEENNCKMPKIKVGMISAKFWPENWRQHLCTCKSCIEMYETQKLSYLVDMQDTVHFYEEKGKAKGLENSESQYEQGMKALSTLDRVQQVEVVSEYNVMKEKLKEYLQKFADNKKIVREEDIREFFSTMAARKKPRLDMPYFCR